MAQFCFLISQNDCMASLQILGPFISCYHTCNSNDRSFVIGSCQVRFLVLISDHSVTTYSALDGTHVTVQCAKTKTTKMCNKLNLVTSRQKLTMRCWLQIQRILPYQAFTIYGNNLLQNIAISGFYHLWQ